MSVVTPSDYNPNVAGTYEVRYIITSVDHIQYEFTRKITFIERDLGSCLYYPSAGAWLRNNKVCEEERDPVYREGTEQNYDENEVIELIKSTASADWNDKELGVFDIYVLKDGEATGKISPGAANTIRATKVFEALTGHITIMLQDYEDHNYPISGGELTLYEDPELTKVYKTYKADEYGMVDVTEDAGKVDKLYFPSYNNADGYYTDIMNVVEVDMHRRHGYAQVKNLKHSRVYLICESETPNGRDYAHDDNACRYVDTRDLGGFGKEYQGTKRIIYRPGDEDILKYEKASFNPVSYKIEYTPVMLNDYAEDNQARMIAENNKRLDLYEDDTNEEKMHNVVNLSERVRVEAEKRGAIDNKLINDVIFDVWELYANGADKANRIYNYTETMDVDANPLVYDEEGAVIGRFVGRYSSGALFHQFSDDEGNPLTNTVVNVSREMDMSNPTKYMTDDRGILMVTDLPDGEYYYQLDRPLKEEYQGCYVIRDGAYTPIEGREYCNETPTENDFMQYADLPSVFSKVFKVDTSYGSFDIETARATSTFVFQEVAEIYYGTEHGYDYDYVLPDDDIAYILNLAESGFDFHQDKFSFEITNDVDHHEMKTTLADYREVYDETDTPAKQIIVDDEMITLIDTVEMKGLKLDAEYTVRGCLMDKSTEKPFIDARTGKEVCAETYFVAEAAEQTVDVTFNFYDFNVTEDTDLVAFEELRNYAGRVVYEHKDYNDEDQTVTIITPKIRTTAFDAEDDNKVLDAELYAGEVLSVNDLVYAEGLKSGKQYKLTGYLVDKTTGEPLVDEEGNMVTGEATFTAESMIMRDIPVHFDINGDLVAKDGFSVVVFEQLWTNRIVDYETGERDDVVIAKHEDVTDEDQTLEVYHMNPSIRTKAHDGADNDQEFEVYNYDPDTLTLVDTVSMTDVKAGRDYRLHGWLMDKSTGEPLTDAAGNRIEAEKFFSIPAGDKVVVDAEESMEFNFSSELVAVEGREIVVFEELYVIVDNEEHFVAEHKDIEDKDQTLTVHVIIPEIHTMAHGSESPTVKTYDVYDYDADELTLVDTVEVLKVKPNRNYRLRGYLVDKDGKPILDADGNRIESSADFFTETANTTVDVEFKFSSEYVSEEGFKVVVFEALDFVKTNDQGEEIRTVEDIAKHEDASDESQTMIIHVVVPEIGTKARDGADNDQQFDVYTYDADELTLVDTVDVKSAKPDRTYRLRGVLMNKTTGEAVTDADGNPITAETIFYTDKADTEVKVEFKFSSDYIAEEGFITVAFEKLDFVKKEATEEEEIVTVDEIAVHEDIEDEEQSLITHVVVPEMKTTAVDGADGDKTMKVYDYDADEITIVDTVDIKNIKPDRDYRLTGTLMNKATGEAVVDQDGQPVTAETVFHAEGSDMLVDVVFKFSSDCIAEEGFQTVVFEKLDIIKKSTDEETGEEVEKTTEVLRHEDLEDEDQTVVTELIVPEIGTTAIDNFDEDKYLEKNLYKDDVVTIRDVVEYKNLKADRDYVMVGHMVDKATGEAIKDKDGHVVEGRTEFHAEGTDGTVIVKIDVPVKDIAAGKKLVAFETLLIVKTDKPEEGPEVKVEKEVVKHEDIEDEAQTVEVFEYSGRLQTIFAFTNGKKNGDAGREIKVVDTVKYENFKPNTEYKMVGTVIDKETGKEVGRGEKLFKTTDVVSGTVEVEIVFDASGKEGKYAVAYEECYEVKHPDKPVAEHKDINDKDQTIEFNKPDNKINTGDNRQLALFAGMNLAALLAVAVIYTKKRRHSLNG